MNRVKRAAMRELREELRRLVAHGPGYLERYAESVLGPDRFRPPAAQALHPMTAKLVRELVQDATVGT